MPSGISIGFVTVTLPYLLTHNGFSVASAAAIVAVGVSANLWRFLWGPVADLTLSLRKWYQIGVLTSIASLIFLCVTPLHPKATFILTIVVFISQVGATSMLTPVGSFMAHRIEENRKGRASGWYQAGNLGGVGLGGGAGLWLATHYTVLIAGIVLVLISGLFSLFVFRIGDVKRKKDKTIGTAIGEMRKDLFSLVRIPIALFVVILICLPIGTGSMGGIWSSIAADWKTDADTVALITGVISGLISAVACVAGGFITDRIGIWKAYLGFGAVYSLGLFLMAFLPFKPYVYVSGVAVFAFSCGLVYAAFSALVLFVVGKKNAATKYALLCSLGNLPVVYMTGFDGWAHDRLGSKYMLVADSVLSFLFIGICIYVLSRMRARGLVLKSVDQEPKGIPVPVIPSPK